MKQKGFKIILCITAIISFMIFGGCDTADTSKKTDAIATGQRNIFYKGNKTIYNNNIVFASDRHADANNNYEIFTMTSSGRNLTRLTNHTSADRHPRWSPDGNKIVFVSNRDRQNPWDNNIYVMNSDGTGLVQLTSHAYDENYPSWSPDGTQIIYSRQREIRGHVQPTTYELWVMNSDGTNQHLWRTVDTMSMMWPDWSSDGRNIVYSWYFCSPLPIISDYGEIWKRNIAGWGSTSAELSSYFYSVAPAHPSISPDRSKIVYDDLIDGYRKLFVVTMSIDFPSLAGVHQDVYYDGSFCGAVMCSKVTQMMQPRWSSDGNYIVAAGVISKNWEIIKMNADGTNIRQITSNSATDVDPDWK